ncbi:hypothetical protein B296_00028409 [Ensete ventricosum]|uniref:SF3 helicase domain-containing protein n=1 Tax=Ensete ventricosum TaxID=4639 RepID=A0A426X903_ENSVE|nr:hypothetical protein B296_00028409 [Ensete ventricosum]
MFEDIRARKVIGGSLEERLNAYLQKHGWPEEYSIEQLQDKYYLLDWLATNLIFDRPIKTKQLFLYGKPNAQKTLMFEMLSKVLNIYFASSRSNDFSGAHDNYDIWVFDEMFIGSDEEAGLKGGAVTKVEIKRAVTAENVGERKKTAD